MYMQLQCRCNQIYMMSYKISVQPHTPASLAVVIIIISTVPLRRTHAHYKCNKNKNGRMEKIKIEKMKQNEGWLKMTTIHRQECLDLGLVS